MVDIFATNYHCGVDNCLIEDLLSLGGNVYMPDNSFKNKIWYLYSVDQHVKKGVRLISYEQFINHPRRFAIMIDCLQHYEDMLVLHSERGKRDEIVLLAAQIEAIDNIPSDLSNFVLAHDIRYYRACKAKYKMLYFNRPHLAVNEEKDFRKAYDNREVHLYQNNFRPGIKNEEIILAEAFKAVWKDITGKDIKFFGINSPDGPLTQEQMHKKMLDSMFTLSFKKIETWGQMANESMLLGTPLIMNEYFLTSTFRDYLITEDTCFLMNVDEDIYQGEKHFDELEEETKAILLKHLTYVVKNILGMSFEEYMNLCMQARAMSELYTSPEPRQKQLKWLFSNITE